MVDNRLKKYDVHPPHRGDQTALAESIAPPVRQATKAISRLIQDHPLISVAVGVTAGVALGCLIKRR